MSFLPKMFYEDGAEGTGKGGAAAATETTKEGENKDTQPIIDPIKTEIPKPIITDEELKSYGYDSPEALKTFLQKQKEESITPEEKLQKENIEKANFLKYGTEQKLITVDEYNAFENIKSKSDQDLVFESFLKDYKEDHPEITDEKELSEAAKDDFDYEYKLKDGVSESAKKKGLAKLARDANDLRAPFESKVVSAKSKFEETTSQEKLVKDNYPKFEKFLKESIVKNTPDKTVLYKAKNGEEEVPVEIELTQKERDAMFKEFSTPKTFREFLDKKPEEVQAILDKKMQGWVKLNKFDEVNAKTFEIAKGIGTKEGSNIGAENSFPLRNNTNAIVVTSETLAESNDKLSNARKKYSAGR